MVFVRFLEKLRIPKSPFESNWPSIGSNAYLDGGTRSMSRLNQTNLNGDGTEKGISKNICHYNFYKNMYWKYFYKIKYILPGVGGPDGKSLLLPPILLPPVKLL